MAFVDLSVKGKASPRHERPSSGKRSGYSNQNVNTKANIFGIAEPSVKTQSRSPVQEISADSITNGVSGTMDVNIRYKTPGAPRGSGVPSIPSDAGVITQSQLEATRKNLGVDAGRETKQKEFQVDGKWYIDNTRRPRSRKAPQGVPKLQLGVLVDKDNELKKPLGNQPHNLATPDSKSSVSWGTPVNNQHYYDHPKTTEEKNYQVCNEDLEERLLSDHRKKPTGIPDLDLQLSHSGNEQFRKALRERNKVEKEKNSNQESADDVARPWRVKPQEEAEKMIKVADEKAKLRISRKNEIIDEALVGDELTKETISAPEEEVSSSFNSPEIGPRTRRHQALFKRNPTATATNSENLLSHRLRFSARVLSKDGHDAHRELNGFFFPGDNTLTVYEFRQFGSRSSALPFIQRGTYHHVRGRTKDEPYSFQDISVGNDFLFETTEQLSLPDTLKRKPYVTLRITDVDKESKQKLAFRDRPSPIGAVTPSHAQRSLSIDDAEDQKIISNVKDLVRVQLRKRGVKSMTALGRYFRTLDTTDDKVLDRDELKEVLQKFNIQIQPDKFEAIWNIVDANHDGVLDYSEFTRNFIGEMNEQRKALVLKVFRKMDPNKLGMVTLMTMVKFFSARQHPQVISGKITEDEVRQQLLNTFENCKTKEEVTYAEFEDYFEGLSLTIDKDEEFVTIMRNCWGI